MTNKNIKIIFMGTPDFAVPILEKLANSAYKPIAVFCAPNMPVGRKQIFTPPPIKVLTQKYNLPVYQPKDKTELSYQLKAISYQLIITAAYGLILPKEVLGTPKYGCLNIHPSLLPKYRGASPIQAAILNGDAKTGVTIYKMDEQIDHGAIVSFRQSLIANRKITTPELSLELARSGADLLLEILPDWLAGEITPRPQDDAKATFTKIIKKEDGQINWQKSAQEIEHQIRAYTPWPGSHTYYSSSKTAGRVEKYQIKILDSDVLEKNHSQKIGEVFLTNNNDLAVQTGSGTLLIKKLQLEGGKPLSAQDFLRGHKDITRQVLE